MKALKHISLFIGLTCLSQIGAQNEDPTKVIPPVKSIGTQSLDVAEAEKTPFHPQLKSTSDSVGIKDYDIPKYPFSFKYQPKTIKPLAYRAPRQKSLNNNYFKIGAGFPLAYTAEAFYGDKLSKTILYGTYFNHYNLLGSSDDRLASNTDFKFFGKKIWKKSILDGNISAGLYSNEFNVASTNEPFSFGTGDVNNETHLRTALSFYNHEVKDGDLLYNLNTNFTYSLASLYGSTYGIHLDNDYELGYEIKEGVIGLDIKHDLININVEDEPTDKAFNTNVFNLTPSFKIKKGAWDGEIGVLVALDQSGFLAWPSLKYETVVIAKELSTYAVTSANIESRSLETLLYQNPYLNLSSMDNFNPDLNTYNTFGGGGIKGTILDKFSYDLGHKGTFSKNAILYVTDSTTGNGNKFSAIYRDMTTQNSYLNLAFNVNKKWHTIIETDYFIYSIPDEEQAWHLPNYTVHLSNFYNIQDVFVVDFSIFLQGNTYNKVGSQIVENGGVTDISLGVDYQYHKNLSFYLDLNNLLNQKYNLWSKYSTIGFNFMTGLKFSI